MAPLLRGEVDEQGAPVPPAAPGEIHLDEGGWARSAFALSLAACAIGLLLALGGWLHEQTSGPLIIGLIVQILGVVLFELAVPRMGGRRKIARLTFYMAANWLLMPIPVSWLCRWPHLYVWAIPRLYWNVARLSCYFLLCAIITAVLAVLRHYAAKK